MIKMMPHMFFFNRALLDAESLGHCIGLLQLKLLLLGVWKAAIFMLSWKANVLPKELLWPPDKEDTEFLMTLGMEVLAWSLRVAILTHPTPSERKLEIKPNVVLLQDTDGT